ASGASAVTTAWSGALVCAFFRAASAISVGSGTIRKLVLCMPHRSHSNHVPASTKFRHLIPTVRYGVRRKIADDQAGSFCHRRQALFGGNSCLFRVDSDEDGSPIWWSQDRDVVSRSIATSAGLVADLPVCRN